MHLKMGEVFTVGNLAAVDPATRESIPGKLQNFTLVSDGGRTIRPCSNELKPTRHIEPAFYSFR